MIRRGDIRRLRAGTKLRSRWSAHDSGRTKAFYRQFAGALLVRQHQGAVDRCASCDRDIRWGDLKAVVSEVGTVFCVDHLGDLVPKDEWPRWVRTAKGLRGDRR